MNITRAGSQPSTKASSDWFTGTVRVDPLFQAPAPGRVGAGKVTFEPGARTAWHTHPLGQTLIVTDGFGRAQREGRSDRGDPAGRHRVDPSRREALAWGVPDHGHDPHRGSRNTRREERELDGEGDG